MKQFTLFSFIFFLTFAAVLRAAETPATEIAPVKYVFLFIGDGMSIPQRMMAEEYLQRTEKRGLRINAMPFQTLTSTRAANAFITDSAAAGTAIACGEKTNNGFLGVDSSGKRLESAAEVAKKNGRKVGIITSVTLNHATPAAFYAHNNSRGNAYDIGLDLVASGFDYFGGGGIEKSDDKKAKTFRGDIYELAAKAGYTVSQTADDFKKIKPGIGKVLSVGAPKALPYAVDAKPDGLNANSSQEDQRPTGAGLLVGAEAPTANPGSGLRLTDFTRQGIEMLQDSPTGFFMMVEGGAIDWMCHANDAATTLGEIIEFDNAVGVAQEFAAKHPKETLIVVTGDHETGGLTLGFSGTGYNCYMELLANQKASVGELGTVIKKFGKENDVTEFEQLIPLITEKSGLVFPAQKKPEKGSMVLTEDEEKDLKAVFEKSLEKGKLAHGSELGRAIVRCVNAKTGIGWTSNAHTALPVNTTAQGPGAELFTNMIDNTDISKRLKTILQSRDR